MSSVLLRFKRSKINVTSVVTVALAVTAGAVTFANMFGQAAVYMVSELPVAAVPSRLNNLGDIVGGAGSSSTGETWATRWNHGSLRPANLGNPGGCEYSSAAGINDAGEIAGAANVTNSIIPFTWTPTRGFQRIPLLPGDNCGQAFSINEQ